nr:division/cell wall cluster transcriptional repressor MraZ [Roseateles albus]
MIFDLASSKVGISADWWVAVANFVFQGASALAMDAKGRLAVPTRHREVLQALCAGQLTITKHPDGCLVVFPRSVWEGFRERVAALPMSASGWKRVFLGNAMDVEIDGAARVLISPELRAAAGLQKDVILMGMGSHFELWDAAAYAAHEAQVMQSEMPDALKDFSF